MYIAPLSKGNITYPSSKMDVLPDTGANVCIAGTSHMKEMKINNNDLNICNKLISTAGGFQIKASYYINARFGFNNTETVQPLYFSGQIKRFFISKTACINLKIIPASFPYCYSLITTKLCGNDAEIVNRKIPSKPTELPFPPTEDNVEKLELYLKQAFSSSAFNESPPFPAMANTIPAKIHLKSDAIPHATHTPIPIPIHWQPIVKQQLDLDVEKGVIEPVPIGEPIQWCSRMVIIQKKNGNLRRTVDYQKLNSQCKRETHHCQPPFYLASHIPRNVKKTVLDAVDGYHAVPLHHNSKHLTTFITPWGAYRYKRLPQGFVASGDAYTRRYDELIAHFPRKVKCIDDVLLWDKDIETSFYRTWDYLTFCAENGIVVSKRKFSFCKDEVEFAGLKIGITGIAPSNKIMKAISDFPSPTNITDARSWFGLVNQVAWAHADSSAMLPFRDLIKPKTTFYWSETLENIFQESKSVLINLVKKGVQSFETSKPTCLQTDWSKQGMGFLLLQKHCLCKDQNNLKCCTTGWKLTYAGSRFTTEIESRYSPTEGEATAVAWSLEKSKFFTLGCNNLFIATDHQPLLGLFGKSLNDISNPRLRRIREKTLMFSFKVVYLPGKKNQGADAISRSPVSGNQCLASISYIDEDINNAPFLALANLNEGNSDAMTSAIEYTGLKEAIQNDIVYNKLKELIKQGFPSSKKELDHDLRCYWVVKDRLTQTESGILLLDKRVIIPKNYRTTILKLLHIAHQGISSMKRRASNTVYWPGLNNDLKNVRENCNYCDEIARQHTKESLLLTPDPDFPFQQVAGDFFSTKGHVYLVLVDRYSGWFTVSHFKENEATAHNLIKECRNLFCAYGAPETFSSDGGSQFTSNEFQAFLKDWSIRHRISSAHYPQSNGRAEAAVKTAKRIISNYVTQHTINNKAIAHAIIQHRNTPLSDIQLSPSQILFHRQLRDKIPTHPHHLRLHKEWILTAKQRETLFKTKTSAMLHQYNAISKDLTPLTPRTKVLILTGTRNPRWNVSGTIVMQLPFRKYRVKLDGSGRIVIRNRRFLRKYKVSKTSFDEFSKMISSPPTDLDATNITTSDVESRLKPYNRPGLCEDTHESQYRTTRSGNKY
jgi:hypothetical protein